MLKWVVHLPQNGTLGFDPRSHVSESWDVGREVFGQRLNSFELLGKYTNPFVGASLSIEWRKRKKRKLLVCHEHGLQPQKAPKKSEKRNSSGAPFFGRSGKPRFAPQRGNSATAARPHLAHGRAANPELRGAAALALALRLPHQGVVGALAVGLVAVDHKGHRHLTPSIERALQRASQRARSRGKSGGGGEYLWSLPSDPLKMGVIAQK